MNDYLIEIVLLVGLLLLSILGIIITWGAILFYTTAWYMIVFGGFITIFFVFAYVIVFLCLFNFI